LFLLILPSLDMVGLSGDLLHRTFRGKIR